MKGYFNTKKKKKKAEEEEQTKTEGPSQEALAGNLRLTLYQMGDVLE